MPLDARLVTLFRDYEQNHRNPVNLRLHKIAIPLIVFHIVAMLDWLKVFAVPFTSWELTAAHVAYVFVVIWYRRLDRTLGLYMAVLFALCFPLGWIMPRGLVVFIALVGWGIQLAGHKLFEKREPSFMHNLQHALVGPLYFVATAVGRWPDKERSDEAGA